ncbi:MAG TPA: hypothetical protein GXZ98_05475 [Firmicutes bacterium]|jgi:predicted  nucleic acid-binding Zn-ribbon protein|nr:hypothetical protein [Bacillota bacterium]
MGKNQELCLLYQYQDARQRLAACEGAIADPKRERALTDLKDRVQAGLAAVKGLEQACLRLKRNNRQLEEECRVYEEQIRELETTLYSGKISVPKELAQLQRRIAEYQKAKADREEQIIDQLYQLESKEGDLAQAQEEGIKLQRQLEGALATETQRVESLRGRLQQIKAEISDLEQALSGELKEYYRRSAKALKGIVVAPVENGLCGFCHVILPPAVLEKVKRGGTGITVCENCGRGLFFQK